MKKKSKRKRVISKTTKFLNSGEDTLKISEKNYAQDIKRLAPSSARLHQAQRKFWDQKPATNEGVLDGFTEIAAPDERHSNGLIGQFKHLFRGRANAIDLGGGNGRVSKGVLLPWFKKVDLVEQSGPLLAGAKKNVPKIRNFIHSGLQDFKFTRRYDCIWVQWVLCYLDDDELMEFLRKAV